MKKTLSIIVAALILFGNVALCSAADVGITASLTKTKAKASYSYGNGGNRVSIEMYYWEKNTLKNDTKFLCKTATVNGSYTTASVTKYADTGYNFKRIDVFGLVGGTLKASLLEVEP